MESSESGTGRENTGEGIALTEQEQNQVIERARPNALVVHEVIREEGKNELRRPVAGLAWSALAAGLSMGFSLVAAGLLRVHLPDTAWRPLLANFGYTVGFVIVITGRQQLFTENTLTPVLPLLNSPNGQTLARLLRL